MKLKFLAVLLFFAPALLGAGRVDCVKDALAFEVFTSGFPKSNVIDEKPTIEITSEVQPGIHGGKRLVIKRIGENWGSNYEAIPAARQGDPRWVQWSHNTPHMAASHFEPYSHTRGWFLQGVLDL